MSRASRGYTRSITSSTRIKKACSQRQASPRQQCATHLGSVTDDGDRKALIPVMANHGGEGGTDTLTRECKTRWEIKLKSRPRRRDARAHPATKCTQPGHDRLVVLRREATFVERANTKRELAAVFSNRRSAVTCNTKVRYLVSLGGSAM